MTAPAATPDDEDSYAEFIDPNEPLVRLAEGLHFSEGPAWNPWEQRLYFSDIPGDTRYRWSDVDGVELVATPTNKANGMTFEADRSLLACEHVTSALVRIVDGVRHVVCATYRGVELNSPNDVVVRSDGSIYFTDPLIGRANDRIGLQRDGKLGFAGVFRIAPGESEPQLVVDRDEFTTPNGLCFSPDERLLYVNDSAHRSIKAFLVDTDGSLSGARKVAAGLGADAGSKSGVDGMECDEHGNIWVTSPGGVWVLDPLGNRLAIISTPESCASLVWGGADLHTLFLTTTTSVHALRTRCGPAPLPHHSAP